MDNTFTLIWTTVQCTSIKSKSDIRFIGLLSTKEMSVFSFNFGPGIFQITLDYAGGTFSATSNQLITVTLYGNTLCIYVRYILFAFLNRSFFRSLTYRNSMVLTHFAVWQETSMATPWMMLCIVMVPSIPSHLILCPKLMKGKASIMLWIPGLSTHQISMLPQDRQFVPQEKYWAITPTA